MKRYFKITLNFLIIAVLIGIQSCQKEELADSLNSVDDLQLKSKLMNRFYSKTVPVGNGVARAWVETSKNGDPLAVGLNLSAKALEKLPDEPQAYVLELPKNKGNNFYTHVLFDWNPDGHEPENIYNVPHFDFHFYIISNEDRLTIPFIPAEDPLYLDSIPPADYIPLDYIELPGLIPEMGAHWVDTLAAELPPRFEPFTHTFIWGSNNGEFIFWEPMITLEYLKSKPDETFVVKQPLKFQKDGWYPMNYKIAYSEKPDEYTVALINLTHHYGQ